MKDIMFDEAFKKELEREIIETINAFSDFFHRDAMSDYEKVLRIENINDFWRGYLLGRIEIACANLYTTKFGKNFTHEEWGEVVGFVAGYGKLMKERIDEKIDGMFGKP